MAQDVRGASEPTGPKSPKNDEQSWEARHVRATYWLDRVLREDVRQEADRRGWSSSQFVSWALQRALGKGH